MMLVYLYYNLYPWAATPVTSLCLFHTMLTECFVVFLWTTLEIEHPGANEVLIEKSCLLCLALIVIKVWVLWFSLSPPDNFSPCQRKMRVIAFRRSGNLFPRCIRRVPLIYSSIHSTARCLKNICLSCQALIQFQGPISPEMIFLSSFYTPS